jgi:hypothetical protein
MISAHSRKNLALVITLALAAVTNAPAHAQASTMIETVIEPIDGAGESMKGLRSCLTTCGVLVL